ncbi:MAG: hypothetical protein MUO19_08945 [Dehalococcoidales bacterium]|nr:hypothetical protein [Dehalococcoidales bacterium]
MNSELWTRLDTLLATSEVVLDRPKGTAHPGYPDLVFPLDYGYLEGTSGGDGQGIDVWQGSADHRDLTAIVCTVDMKKRDAEYKLIIGCTGEELGIIEEFHNGRYQAAIVIRRPAG